MRIIPDDITPYNITMSGDNKKSNLYFEAATIEITDDEWNEIVYWYNPEYIGKQFSQYLRELIELARAK